MIRVVDRGSGWATVGPQPLGNHVSQTTRPPLSTPLTANWLFSLETQDTTPERWSCEQSSGLSQGLLGPLYPSNSAPTLGSVPNTTMPWLQPPPFQHPSSQLSMPILLAPVYHPPPPSQFPPPPASFSPGLLLHSGSLSSQVPSVCTWPLPRGAHKQAHLPSAPLRVSPHPPLRPS